MLSDIYKYMFQNRIGCVKVSVPASCVVDSSNDRVKPKITTLLFAASPRSFNE